MKKLTLILTITLISFTTNTFSANKDNKTSNQANTPYSVNIDDNGIETKVYITSDEKTGELETRTVYMTGVDGRRLGTLIYRWDSSIGWIQNLKTEYLYNQNNELVQIVKSKWDTNNSEWINKLVQDIQAR